MSRWGTISINSVPVSRVGLALLPVLLLLPDQTVRGQDTEADTMNRTAVTIGFGKASTPEYDFTFFLQGARSRGRHRFSGRIASMADVVAERGQTDLAVLYGPALSWTWGQVSVGTGIALTWGERTSTSDPRTVPGLPFGATLYLTPPIGYGTVGVTASGFANVNERQSFAGVAFGLVIGDLR